VYLVIAYDIATDTRAGEKRLRDVARICESFGQRVQKSVFECALNDLRYMDLVRRLSEVIHPAEDSIRIYRVQEFSRKTVRTLGRETGIDLDEPLIL
jgi:CRISPR-associated protein Cas2